MQRQLYFSSSRIAGDNNICDLSTPFRLNCTGYEVFEKDERRVGCRQDYFCILLDKDVVEFSGADRRLRLKAGEAILIPPGITYHLRPIAKGTACYWMHFTGYDIDRLLKTCDIPTVTPFPLRKSEEVSKLFRQLFGMFIYQDNYFATETAGQCMRILAQLGRLSSPQALNDTPKKAIEYIHSHLAESFSIETLANLQETSISSFYRSFVAQMGVSPKQYIIDLRLTTACTLLR